MHRRTWLIATCLTTLSGCALVPTSILTGAPGLGGSPGVGATAGSVPVAVAAPTPRPVTLSNPYLQPVDVAVAAAAEPTKEAVQQVLTLTRGDEIEKLPAEAGTRSLKVIKQSETSAWALLGADFEEKEGTGCASPADEAALVLAHPGLVAYLPVYGARPAAAYRLATLPPQVDLRPIMPQVRDQGDRPTCVAFSTVGILDYLYAKGTGAPSKLASPQFLNWLYHGVCKSQLQPESLWIDTGTFTPALLALLREQGNPSWPYVPPGLGTLSEGHAKYTKLPPDGAPTWSYEAAAASHFSKSLSDKLVAGETFTSQGAAFVGVVANVASLRAALAGEQPVQVAVPIYVPDWYNPPMAQQGHMPELDAAKLADKANIGYHSVVLVGYEPDATAPGGGWFLVRNSWGANWGLKGHCRLSYDYVTSFGYGFYLAAPYDQSFQAVYPMNVPKKPAAPTPGPSPSVTPAPSPSPTSLPSPSPSIVPSVLPSVLPSAEPSASPGPTTKLTLTELGRTPIGDEAFDLELDAAGNAWVTYPDIGKCHAMKIAPDGTVLGSQVISTSAYRVVLDAAGAPWIAVDAKDGRQITTISASGEIQTALTYTGAYMTGFAFDPDGGLWTALAGHLVKQAQDGTELLSTPMEWPAPPELDPKGRVWVSTQVKDGSGQAVSGLVAVSRTDGKIVKQFPLEANGSVRIGPTGELYVVQATSRKVAHVSEDGAVLATVPYGSPEELAPLWPAIAFDPAGNVWMAKGTALTKYGPDFEPLAGFPLPEGANCVAVSPSGLVWATTLTDQVVRFQLKP